MNYQRNLKDLKNIVAVIGWDEAFKRLRPIGSGATTCFAGREADGEARLADEERSDREDRRVSPVSEKGIFCSVCEVVAFGATRMCCRRSDCPNPLRDESDAPLGASGRRNVRPLAPADTQTPTQNGTL